MSSNISAPQQKINITGVITEKSELHYTTKRHTRRLIRSFAHTNANTITHANTNNNTNTNTSTIYLQALPIWSFIHFCIILRNDLGCAVSSCFAYKYDEACNKTHDALVHVLVMTKWCKLWGGWCYLSPIVTHFKCGCVVRKKNCFAIRCFASHALITLLDKFGHVNMIRVQ